MSAYIPSWSHSTRSGMSVAQAAAKVAACIAYLGRSRRSPSALSGLPYVLRVTFGQPGRAVGRGTPPRLLLAASPKEGMDLTHRPAMISTRVLAMYVLTPQVRFTRLRWRQ